MTMHLGNIKTIIPNYDVFLVDVVGVVHDGINPHKIAVDTLNAIKSAFSKEVIFLSNSAKLSSRSYIKLLSMGLHKDTKVFTSGEANKYVISKNQKEKKVYHFGANCNPEINIDLADFFVQDIKNANIILLTAFLEEGENANKYQQEIDYIVKNNIPVICANPDIKAFYGNSVRLCAGYIAKILEEKGISVQYTGKPKKFIYDLVYEKYGLNQYDKSKILMIGDTMETDILGAYNFDIDSLLLLTGNTMADITKNGVSLDKFLSQYSYKPTYYMNQLLL